VSARAPSSARTRLRELSPALLLGGLALLLLFSPVGWPCPTRTILGIPCPGCGMTRAARLVLHGDFAAATRMHPLWFAVLPALAVLGVAEGVGFARQGRWGIALESAWTRRVGAVLVVALVVVWVARFFGAFGGPVPR
jgi:hypothetical protein